MALALPESTYVSALGVKTSVAGTTATSTLALDTAPSRSVTEAVSVCVPRDRPGTTTVRPVPRAPSRLDVQRTTLERSPSSASAAAAARSTGRPARNVPAAAGATTRTTGGTFGGRTTTRRAALPVSPPESAAVAVTVWVPVLRLAVENAGPAPICPSRSESQRSAAERSPSVASVAVPLNATLVPTKTVVPSAGAAMVRSGAVGVTVSRAVADAAAPSESVTEATSVWAPSESRRVPFGPSAPSRLDVQRISPVRSPSKSSRATAPRRTAVPAGTEPPSAGLPIVTTGGVLGARTRTSTCASPRRSPEFVAAAVTVCSPMLSVLVMIAAPAPSAPSRLDIQTMRLDTSPSSASLASAAKRTGSPWTTTAPLAGAAMVTAGALRATATTSVGAGPPSRDR